MLNVVVIMGRLTATPELRTTNSGISVTSFSVAVNRNYSKDGNNQTDFINCVAWRNNAEFITKYFGKGQMIAIRGSLQQSSYTDKDGNNRTAFEVVANNVQFVESKRDSSSDDGASFSNADVNDFAEMDADMDSDLPF